MYNFLQILVENIKNELIKGYYDIDYETNKSKIKLKELLSKEEINIIAEIKSISPSKGVLRKDVSIELAQALIKNGAIGLSILTEPNYFGGSLEYFFKVSKEIEAPLVFKDIIVDKKQVDAANKIGADIILLIYEVFKECHPNYGLKEIINYCREKEMEILLEFHDSQFIQEIFVLDFDYLGVNNRNLFNLSLDKEHFFKISSKISKIKPIIAESGYEAHDELVRDRSRGADAFLIGTAIMASKNPVLKLKELIHGGED